LKGWKVEKLESWKVGKLESWKEKSKSASVDHKQVEKMKG
jgi:hypothetical protein